MGKRGPIAILVVVCLLLAMASFAIAAPRAQDIIVPGGPRGDIQSLYRSFDGGAYEAPVVSLAPFDEDTGAAITIDVVHHETHEGEMWHAESTSASVANNASVDLLFHAGGGVEPHSVFEVLAGGQVTVSLYESPVISNTGIALAYYNMNRTITETAHSQIYLTPVLTSTGSVALVNARLLPGGTSPQTRVGGGIRQGTEWILAPGKYYLLRVTNTSGSATAVNMIMEWYEEQQ